MALLFPKVRRFRMENVNISGIDMTITTMLGSIVSRVNMISGCLPDDLQANMEEVRTNIISVLNDLDCDISLSDKEGLTFLDKVSLFMELSSISNDLGVCTLITSNNVLLEDALYNIELIMKKMAEYDSVFRCCYSNYSSGKKRVLK